MKLKDAIFEMKISDQFEFTQGDNFITKTSEHEIRWRKCGVSFTIGDFLDYGEFEGEIVPAKSKVLTAEEIYKKMVEPLKIATHGTIYLYGEAMHKNGRLEYAQDLEPLVDYLKNFANSLDSEGFSNDAENLRKQLKNFPKP